MSEVYMACGVYKEGDKITAYRLMKSDGSTVDVSRERLIRMITEGCVHNMRVQITSGGEVIRGKGINLSNLRVYSAESDKIKEYNIVKRIIKKKKCIGYEVVDTDGGSKNISVKTAYKMISDGSIVNADIAKKNINGKEYTVIVGKGIKLSSLEEVIITNGKMLNDKNKESVTCRVLETMSSGIIYDKENDTMQRFIKGQVIAYNPNGRMYVLSKDSIEYTEKKTADSDSNEDRCEEYIIKYSNGEQESLSKEKVNMWKVARIANSTIRKK
jgi:hypothetical protein